MLLHGGKAMSIKVCKYMILIQPSSAAAERFLHYCQTPSNKVKKEH